MSANYTTRLYERCPVVASAGGGAIAPGTVLTGAIDMSDMREIMAIVFTGATLGTTPTIDFKYQSATTSGGTYADVNSSWKITTLNAANKIATLTLRAESLPQQGAGRFIKGLLTVGGTGNSECGVIVIGGNLRYESAQLAPVVQAAAVVGNYFFTN